MVECYTRMQHDIRHEFQKNNNMHGKFENHVWVGIILKTKIGPFKKYVTF